MRFGDLGGNNGLYHPDTGLIELDIDPQHRGASNAFLFSVSHELGHAVKERIGSEAWNAFAEYAVKAKGGEDAVKAKQNSSEAYANEAVAREEVVCDFIGELLSEQTALDDLCTSIKSGAVKLETARGIVTAWHKLLNLFKGKTAQQTDAETAALVKRVQEQFGADIETAENAVKKLQQALSAALQTERSSNGKNRTVKASDKDTVDRETSMGYDKGSMEERSAENGLDRGRRTADIPREVYSGGEIGSRDSTGERGNEGTNRRGNRAGGENTRGQKIPVFQYQTATPYQRARIDELVSLTFDASEEWRDYLLTHPNVDMVSEVMQMYEEGDPRLRGMEETVPGLSEALYEVEAFIRQTTARQTETAGQAAEQRGDTSLSEASDSEGNRLTKAQRDYFKDSVFRDREGRLLVLYHGSHFESFSVFELFRGIWMTTDKAYAETFAEFRDESEPLAGEVYTDEDLKLYKLYAKAKRPANLGEIDGKLTEERLRELAESLHVDYRTLENLFGYDIGKNATFAVTRTERFLQLAREQGFDSFTATESGVPTYCVFANRNQVALTTNEAPTEHRDIRYSKKDTPDGDGTTATKAEDMPTARETVEAETSQNKQAETVALSDYGTQNDLSHEQHSDQAQPTVHSLLMETDASKVENATERKYLKEYQQTAARQLAEQQKLDKLQAELDALPKEKRQTSRARFLRDEIIKTKNRLQICQSIQTRLETNSPLTYLINREINPRLAEVQKNIMAQAQRAIDNLAQSGIIKKEERTDLSIDHFLEMFSPEDARQIREILQLAPNEIIALFNCYNEHICIDPNYESGGSNYSRAENTIRVNIANMNVNVFKNVGRGQELFKNAYNELFHEVAHAIDNIAGRNMDGETSSTRFSAKFVSDKHKMTLLQALRREVTHCIITYGKTELITMLKDMPLVASADISDIFNALTKNRIVAYTGHDMEYYVKDGPEKVAAEAFAEMFSAEINNPASLVNFKRFFPISYSIFKEMLETMLEIHFVR